MAYKPEQAVDLDTGVIVAAAIHPADEGASEKLPRAIEAAASHLEEVGLAPGAGDPRLKGADKG